MSLEMLEMGEPGPGSSRFSLLIFKDPRLPMSLIRDDSFFTWDTPNAQECSLHLNSFNFPMSESPRSL